jgi:hypothetical protein
VYEEGVLDMRSAKSEQLTWGTTSGTSSPFDAAIIHTLNEPFHNLITS